MSEHDFLFEKMFFQTAHISILDLALQEAQVDLIKISRSSPKDVVGIVEEALQKINVAYKSVEKLKNGTK